MNESPGFRAAPYALNSGEGWTYQFGIPFDIKASEIQQGSGVALLEYFTKKGEEPPDHTHPTEDEMFYVLEGSITFRCAGKAFDLEKGGFMFLPRGIEHGYTIRSDDGVRLLAVTAPTRKPSPPVKGWGGFVSDMELGQGELVKSPPFVAGS